MHDGELHRGGITFPVTTDIKLQDRFGRCSDIKNFSLIERLSNTYS